VTGLPSERSEYNRKRARIDCLQKEILAATISGKGSLGGTKAQWNKEVETEIHQDEAHQPYRSREKKRQNPAETLPKNDSSCILPKDMAAVYATAQ
jgi:hypothetical protein